LRPGVRRTVDGLCVVAARRVHLANVAGEAARTRSVRAGRPAARPG
jgi:hypothetical protein